MFRRHMMRLRNGFIDCSPVNRRRKQTELNAGRFGGCKQLEADFWVSPSDHQLCECFNVYDLKFAEAVLICEA